MTPTEIIDTVIDRVDALCAAAARVDSTIAPGHLTDEQITSLGARSDQLATSRQDILQAIGVLTIAQDNEARAARIRSESALATMKRTQSAITAIYRAAAMLDLATVSSIPVAEADATLRSLHRSLDASLLDALAALERLTILVQPPESAEARVVPLR